MTRSLHDDKVGQIFNFCRWHVVLAFDYDMHVVHCDAASCTGDHKVSRFAADGAGKYGRLGVAIVWFLSNLCRALPCHTASQVERSLLYLANGIVDGRVVEKTICNSSSVCSHIGIYCANI